MCKLSIIVPFYNSARFLKRCIESLEDQDIEKSCYEIIMVDDGSTDEGASIVKHYQGVYPNIKLYSQPNSGQGAGRNLGLAHSRGEYISFVDSDDYVLPNKLSNILSLCDHLEQDILYCFANVYDSIGKAKKSIEFHDFNEDVTYRGDNLLLSNIIVGSVWAKFYSRNFLLNNNLKFGVGFTHQDSDFMYRCLVKAKKVNFLNDIFYSYCWNEGSTIRTKDSAQLVHSLKSSLIVASNLVDMGKSQDLSEDLRSFLIKRKNSMVIGQLFFLLDNAHDYTTRDILDILKFARKRHLFPIKGESESKLSTIFSRVANIRAVFLLMFWINKWCHVKDLCQR